MKLAVFLEDIKVIAFMEFTMGDHSIISFLGSDKEFI